MKPKAVTKSLNLRSTRSLSPSLRKPGSSFKRCAISSSERRDLFTMMPLARARAFQRNAPQRVVVLVVLDEEQDGREIAVRPHDSLAGVRSGRRDVDCFGEW